MPKIQRQFFELQEKCTSLNSKLAEHVFAEHDWAT